MMIEQSDPTASCAELVLLGGHPATQLRRLCPGDVRASGGSVLLVPVITLCTVDLEECVRGAAETGELLMSSVANALRQRDPELYVITKTHGYFLDSRIITTV